MGGVDKTHPFTDRIAPVVQITEGRECRRIARCGWKFCTWARNHESVSARQRCVACRSRYSGRVVDQPGGRRAASIGGFRRRRRKECVENVLQDDISERQGERVAKAYPVGQRRTVRSIFIGSMCTDRRCCKPKLVATVKPDIACISQPDVLVRPGGFREDHNNTFALDLQIKDSAIAQRPSYYVTRNRITNLLNFRNSRK